MDKIIIKCETCGERAHNFVTEEALSCIPPREILQFGNFHIDREYRLALYTKYPFFTTEEVVGSFLGHNPNFPSQDEWLENGT